MTNVSYPATVPESKPSAVLAVRDLRVRYQLSNTSLCAVNGITFSLGGGESLGIVGESGSGKSTLALALLRLLGRNARISGSLLLSDLDLLAMSGSALRDVRGKRISMIFQDPMTSLNPVMTVGDQISEALRVHLRVSRKAAQLRAIELLDLVGVPDPAGRARAYPHQLSGGLRQRAMIAIAVSCEPDVLVADEPTTALDVTVQAQILDLLFALGKERGMAIVLVSHDLGVIASAVDRVIVMYAGYMVEEGRTADVLRSPLHPYTVALLNSMVTLEGDRRERLTAIPGSPPTLWAEPAECPFAQRCPHVHDECLTGNPALRQAQEAHRVACVMFAASHSTEVSDPSYQQNREAQ